MGTTVNNKNYALVYTLTVADALCARLVVSIIG